MNEKQDQYAFAASIAAECSSPVRLMILQLLLEEGECRVRIMSERLGVAESTLSNHLKRMRDSQIVKVTRAGRAATYSIADLHVGEVVSALLRAAGLVPEYATIEPDSGLAYARSCYDHLAGEIGVKLTNYLIREGAIVPEGNEVLIGEFAEKCFSALGVGLSGIVEVRKRSFLCDDWTHGEKHLAGALGAALLQGLISRKWILPVAGSRELVLTKPGDIALNKIFDER
ncbi:MAG: metalloregulator ArsR/SmtB family transcription factor [Corynebacterium sp.]|uniref:ArsR/SmtB family transcription factor n=1 Tax=Corynebacterium sp. TaxID=1720 RepID=UPI0026DAAB33|nr:metalloregulator ArsR/SmtB family transcription factor [Corynebacterium sp.]MDO4762030.1 metalloregulator ArsR/SmtB family transcription factor [Corynebacterium sp.]